MIYKICLRATFLKVFSFYFQEYLLNIAEHFDKYDPYHDKATRERWICFVLTTLSYLRFYGAVMSSQCHRKLYSQTGRGRGGTKLNIWIQSFFLIQLEIKRILTEFYWNRVQLGDQYLLVHLLRCPSDVLTYWKGQHLIRSYIDGKGKSRKMILLKFHEIQFTLDLLANLAGGSSERAKR